MSAKRKASILTNIEARTIKSNNADEKMRSSNIIKEIATCRFFTPGRVRTRLVTNASIFLFVLYCSRK